MTWTIEAKLLPLLGISGHLYLEIFNDAGERVLQVNGFAADVKTDKARKVGVPTDHLKVYTSDEDMLDETRDATRDHHPHKGHVLFEGTQQDIQKAVLAIYAAKAEFNKKHLHYIVLSQNSNSVFMYMMDALSSVLPLKMDLLKPIVDMKPYLPGINKQIDGKGGYKSLRERFNQAGKKRQARVKRKPSPGF